MIYTVRHRSSYAYRQTVDLSYHVLHLTPRSLPHQRVIDVDLHVTPAAPTRAGSDYFGNDITFLSLAQPHDSLMVESTATVEVTAPAALDPAGTPAWEEVRDTLEGGGFPQDVAAAEFVHASPLVPPSEAIALYAASSFAPGRPLLAAALDLTHRIHRDFVYDQTATAVTTPLAEVMQHRRGVCQDFAHVEIGALRAMGLAARYVSGYIRTYGPGGTPSLVGTDGSHAWIAVFCPGIGWIDLDPTNDLIVGDEHIVLAWGRDYDDVSPIRGVILGGGEHMPTVGVAVMPVG